MRINMKLLLLLVAVLLVAVLLVAASVAASLSVWRSTLLMPSTQIRRGILMHLLRRIGV
jgi:P pilus assembly chaperone PapD